MTNDQLYGEIRGLLARMTTIEAEVQRMRDKYHDIPNKVVAPIQEQLLDIKLLMEKVLREKPAERVERHAKERSGEDRHITVLHIWIVLGTITVTVTVLAFLGKIVL